MSKEASKAQVQAVGQPVTEKGSVSVSGLRVGTGMRLWVCQGPRGQVRHRYEALGLSVSREASEAQV